MEIHKVAEKVKLLLINLGDDANQIAAFLEGQGIKGNRSSSFKCPIAEFLKQNLSTEVFVETTSTIIVEDYVKGNWNYIKVETLNRVYHSEAVRNFIKKFDKGAYPALEAQNHPSI